MKLNYLAPDAEIRFLLSKDIIAASGEASGEEPENPLNPEQTPGMDLAEDPFIS